jgi:hypothetical protein
MDITCIRICCPFSKEQFSDVSNVSCSLQRHLLVSICRRIKKQTIRAKNTDNTTGRLEHSTPHESLSAKTPGRQREQIAVAVLNRRL